MVESTSFEGRVGAVGPPPVAMYDLRPLSTGEILDRTFSLYRRRFWLYAGLSAIASSLLGVLQITQQMFIGQVAVGVVPGALPNKLAVVGLLGTMVTYVLYLVAYAITQAATVSAVSTIYLGHETSFGKAMGVAGGKWWRYILIALWQIWSWMWIFMVLLFPSAILIAMRVPALAGIGIFLLVVAFGSLIYGIFAYIRNSLAVSASVFEGLTVRKAMRRSKTLVKGRIWGIFLMLLLLFALRMVAGMLAAPFAMMMVAFTGKPGLHLVGESLTVLLTFITGALVGPIGAIALCLFYIDQRVRHEGFDLEAMMDPSLGSGALPRSAPAAPPPPPLVGGFAPSGFTASGYTAEPVPFVPSGFTEPSPSGDGD